MSIPPKYSREANWLLTEKYDGAETQEFFNDLKRLDAGEPVDYVIGFSEFLDCRIGLSSRPLIPRNETEFWVREAIDHLQARSSDASQPLRILDIFAGSGCIGLAVAKHLPTAHVDLAEMDHRHIVQIHQNIELNTLDPEQVRVFESDIFENIPRTPYDAILANPPYISDETRHTVEASVLDHEPHKALFAKDKGLFFVHTLLQESPRYLAKNGDLFIEFSPEQQPAIESALAHSVFTNWEFRKDQFGRFRTVWIQK